LSVGLKQNKIAKLLNKTHNAVCQELKKNPANTKIGYSSKIANENTKNRRIDDSKRFRKMKIMFGLEIILLKN